MRTAQPPSTSTSLSDTEWLRAHGGVLALHSPTDGRAVRITSPNSRDDVQTYDLEFFTRGGNAYTALDTLDSVRATCGAWSAFTPRSDSPWTLALQRGVAIGIAFDSLAGQSARDSLTTVIAAAQLAARTPGDSADELRGLPYVVREAWSTTIEGRATLLVALAERSLELEAAPIAEHVLVIAERSDPNSPWRLMWGERRSAGFAEAESDDLLGAVRFLGDGTVTLFIERGTGLSGEVVAYMRAPTGWIAAWVSPRIQCVEPTK